MSRGTDPLNTVYALKRAAILIKELAGGEISSDIIDVYPKVIEPFRVNMLFKNINRLIGKSIPKEIIFDILHKLDIETEKESESGS